MVEGLILAEKEVSEADQAAALERARAHWLLALTELEDPGRKPCLVLVAGLPGTGKSCLARGLGEHAGFRVVRSDVVRRKWRVCPSMSRLPHSFGIHSTLRSGLNAPSPDCAPCVGEMSLAQYLSCALPIT